MKFLDENRMFLTILIPFMAIPWITLDRFHLILFNFSAHRLEYFGHAIEMSTSWMILMLLSLGITIALMSALTLSRFYCGTLCPNTFLGSLVRVITSRKRTWIEKSLGFILVSLLSFAFAFSVVAYGVETTALLDALVHLRFEGWLVLLLFVLLLAEVYMVEGWYCAHLCPYGALCTLLPIHDRLTYRFDDPHGACTACGGCVRICPIPDLDIRQGFDPRCIQCGLCAHACAKTFAKIPHITPLITREKRSMLHAAGQGFTIALVLIILLEIAILLTILHPQHLNECFLSNDKLYPPLHAPK